MRVDKYLWSIRVFKTRTMATTAVKNNRVSVGGKFVKPAKDIEVDQTIQVKKNGVVFSFQVLDIPKGRLGAKLVPNYMRDVTTPEEQEKLRMILARNVVNRKKGEGRPTKKERRDIEAFAEEWDWSDWDDMDD